MNQTTAALGPDQVRTHFFLPSEIGGEKSDLAKRGVGG